MVWQVCGIIRCSSYSRSVLKGQSWSFDNSLIKHSSSHRFILEGIVAPELHKFSTSLLSNPLIMVKSWSNLQVKKMDCPFLTFHSQYCMCRSGQS